MGWIHSGLACGIKTVYADLVQAVKADVETFQKMAKVEVHALRDDDEAYVVQYGSLACWIEIQDGPKDSFVVANRGRPGTDDVDLRMEMRAVLDDAGKRILWVKADNFSYSMTFEGVSRQLLQPMLLADVMNAP